MAQTIIMVVSALAAGFIGLYFTQQAQHHKWLLERRAEVFARFLQLICDARISIRDILYDKELENHERQVKVNEAGLPAANYARIVRLYLPSTLRQEFDEKAKDYLDRYSTPDLGDSRLKKVNEDLDRIQQIFEQELSSHQGLHAIVRASRRVTSCLRRKQ